MSNLSPKMKRFCQEYLIDLNATQAAIRAGYSKKTAGQIGEQNLKKLEIQIEIKRLMESRSKRTEIKADAVLEELANIAFDDIGNHLSFYTNQEGEMQLNIKDSDKTDTRAIQEVSLGKNGFRFKMYCKENALVKLGQHLGLFAEHMRISGDPDNPLSIETKDKTLEELLENEPAKTRRNIIGSIINAIEQAKTDGGTSEA